MMMQPLVKMRLYATRSSFVGSQRCRFKKWGTYETNVRENFRLLFDLLPGLANRSGTAQLLASHRVPDAIFTMHFGIVLCPKRHHSRGHIVQRTLSIDRRGQDMEEDLRLQITYRYVSDPIDTSDKLRNGLLHVWYRTLSVH